MKSLRKYLNSQIDIKYWVGKKYDGQLLIKKLKDEKSIRYYKTFFQKTIQDIFSEDITHRNKTCSNDHNKQLIEKLLNDSDEEKRRFYNRLFNLKLIDCLQHFRNYAYWSYLVGMETFDDIKEGLKKENVNEDYIKDLKKTLDEFENDLNK